MSRRASILDTQTLKKALDISKELKAFGYKPKSSPIKVNKIDRLNKLTGLNIPKRRFERVKKEYSRFPQPIVLSSPAPSHEQLVSIIAPLIRQHIAEQPAQELPEVTPEFVKEVVKAMHALPENDKLEVSKGIRNASSFIYGGTKYGVHEMMHGGASSSALTIFVNNEVVAGSGTTFTLANTPTVGSVDVFALGQHLVPTVDYTISGAVITTVSSWSTGNILASYRY